MIIVGVGFKLAVVPFHLWTPDVYEGAPAPVTAFIATVSKGAVFAVLLRLTAMMDLRPGTPVFQALSVIAVASMFGGNLLALQQENVKRLLAYSSIAHAGYILVALLAGGPDGRAAVFFYLAAYFITTLGAFGTVSVLSRKDGDAVDIEDYQGLAWRRPWLAAVFVPMLLSLAGMPLTAGFVGKFFLAAAGIGSSLWVLVAALAASSVIGLFYYLRLIALLFAGPGGVVPVPASPSFANGSALAILVLLLLLVGIYPGPLLDLVGRALR
jgi:NADH-quinone oxidoreductase subunit N